MRGRGGRSGGAWRSGGLAGGGAEQPAATGPHAAAASAAGPRMARLDPSPKALGGSAKRAAPKAHPAGGADEDHKLLILGVHWGRLLVLWGAGRRGGHAGVRAAHRLPSTRARSPRARVFDLWQPYHLRLHLLRRSHALAEAALALGGVHLEQQGAGRSRCGGGQRACGAQRPLLPACRAPHAGMPQGHWPRRLSSRYNAIRSPRTCTQRARLLPGPAGRATILWTTARARGRVRARRSKRGTVTDDIR